MKALVLNQYRKLDLLDVPSPDAAPNEVLVRVRSCGICGSDVHGYDGSSGRRIPPVIMGHEASGVVAEVGTAARAFDPGDRVTFDSMICCRRCVFCRAGRPNLCEDRRVLGVSCGDYRRHGAFAEYVTVPDHVVFRVPDEVSFDEAAMVEPVSVAVHAVARANPALGDKALVVGAGMIGLLTIQALRSAGCGRIFAADLAADRLRLAKELGADEIIQSGDGTDVPAVLREMTGGLGADVVMEAVGIAETVAMSIESVRKGGTVVLIGNIAPTVGFGLQSVVTREIDVLGSCASSNDYPACLDMMRRGAIRVRPVLSASVPLERGQEMFDRLYAREPGLTKVILHP
ncbi:MAG: galactitol-1-phosphate 5-dehydrogenase [Acidobacteriota bacterium]|nr:galactitol-1-phosphate 5-dehydrogenase [Acidobacteriota bacterium]